MYQNEHLRRNSNRSAAARICRISQIGLI